MTDLPFLLQASDVFGILELVGEIAVFLGLSDLSSLARVSSQCHHKAIRRIWRILLSPVPLLILLPGVTYLNGQLVRSSYQCLP